MPEAFTADDFTEARTFTADDFAESRTFSEADFSEPTVSPTFTDEPDRQLASVDALLNPRIPTPQSDFGKNLRADALKAEAASAKPEFDRQYAEINQHFDSMLSAIPSDNIEKRADIANAKAMAVQELNERAAAQGVPFQVLGYAPEKRFVERTTAEALEPIGITGTPAKVAAGVQNIGADFLEMFKDPMVLGSMGLAKVAPEAAHVIGRAFGMQMLAHSPAQAKAIYDAWKNKDTTGVVRDMGNLVVSLGLGGKLTTMKDKTSVVADSARRTAESVDAQFSEAAKRGMAAVEKNAALIPLTAAETAKTVKPAEPVNHPLVGATGTVPRRLTTSSEPIDVSDKIASITHGEIGERTGRPTVVVKLESGNSISVTYGKDKFGNVKTIDEAVADAVGLLRFTPDKTAKPEIVTEKVTETSPGLRLVELQRRVNDGEVLPEAERVEYEALKADSDAASSPMKAQLEALRSSKPPEPPSPKPKESAPAGGGLETAATPTELPPVREGFVRYYTGAGEKPGFDFSPDIEYAKGYANMKHGEKGKVWYVDVPKDSPFLKRDTSAYGEGSGREILLNSKLPPEIVRQAKPIGSGLKPAAEPTGPVKPVEPPVEPKAKEPWEMTREEYKGDDYDKMIWRAARNDNITYEAAEKLSRIDSSGNKQFWAKTREEIESEGADRVKRLRGERAENNKLKGSEAYASWRIRSKSRTLKADIESAQNYTKGLLDVHKDRISEAIAEGKPVPKEVLADYPDLVKPPEPPAKAAGKVEADTVITRHKSVSDSDLKSEFLKENDVSLADTPEKKAALQNKFNDFIARRKQEVEQENKSISKLNADNFLSNPSEAIKQLESESGGSFDLGEMLKFRGVAETSRKKSGRGVLAHKGTIAEGTISPYKFTAKIGDRTLTEEFSSANDKRTLDRHEAGVAGRLARQIAEEQSAKPTEKLAEEKPAGDLDPDRFGMGGAIDLEFQRGQGSPTAMKYRRIDAERQKRGLQPLAKPAGRSDQAVLDRAIAEIDKDPSLPERLVKELNDNPRPIQDWENHVLMLRKIELRYEYEKSAREAAQAWEDSQAFPERRAEMDAANARTQMWSERLEALEQASRKSGSERGRALRSLQVMVNEDFTLASLELRKRAAKGGEPLTPSERADLIKIADDYKAKADALEKSVSEREQKAAEIAVKEALDRVEKEAAKAPRYSAGVLKYAEQFASYMDGKASEAKARLQERMGRTSTGVDPTILSDVAIVGAAKITRGLVDFAKWSEAMRKELGDWVKPHLPDVFRAAQAAHDSEISALGKRIGGKVVEKVRQAAAKTATVSERTATLDRVKEKVSKGEKYDISYLARKLARLQVENGVRGRDALIDAVHKDLLEIIPDLTRREAMDAISGYGDFSPLTKDATSIVLRDLKGQMQQIGKLEDMAAGTAPKKTGPERRTPSEEERRLIKQVEEAKRRGGYRVTDPASQLRTSLQSAKTAIRHQLEDLQHEINKRERIVKNRTPLTPDAELLELRRQRDELKKQHDEIFGARTLSEAQKIRMAEAALDKQIEKVKGQLESGRIFPEGKSEKPKLSSPGIDAKSAELAELKLRRYYERQRLQPRGEPEAAERLKVESSLRAVKTRMENQIAELEKAITSRQKIVRDKTQLQYDADANRLKARRDELKKQYDDIFPREPLTDAQKLAAWKIRTQRRIEELTERLKASDFSKKPKAELKLDSEAVKIRFQLDVIKRRFNEELLKTKLANQSGWERSARYGVEAINSIRAIRASIDLSAVLRQGGFIVFGHPIRGAKSFPAMFQALRSKEWQFAAEQQILARPNYPIYERSGLSLTEHGHRLSQMEEAYMSRWAEHIPGVAASQRAYTVFLNKLRADSFDAMAKSVAKGRELTLDEARIISNFINVATGRGNIGLSENALVGWNTVFFAPRLVASRFQLLAGQPLYHGLLSGKTKAAGSARARIQVAKEYARFLAGIGVVYTLSQMIPGVEPIELDPRSSDFLKIKIGNSRIDPMAGLIQNTVLLSKTITGESKTSSGRIIPIVGADVPFGHSDLAGVWGTFFRTKLAPVPGTALNIRRGENVVREPVDMSSAMWWAKEFGPLSIGEIYETMKEQGVPKGSALAILSIFGMGLQTYEPKASSLRIDPRTGSVKSGNKTIYSPER